MKTNWIVFISVILTGAIVGWAVFYFQENRIQDLQDQVANPSSDVITPTATPTTTSAATANWNTFESSLFGYSFKYDATLSVDSSTTKTTSDVTVKDINDHWVYEIKINPNTNNLSLSAATDQIAQELLSLSSSATASDVTTSDISVGGKSAKKFVIAHFGDIGNVGAVVIDNGNIVYIHGDASNATNSTDFTTFLSTIKFTN